MSRAFDGNDKLEVISAVVAAAPFTIALWLKRTAATATSHSLAGIYTNGSTSDYHRILLSNAHLLQVQSQAGSLSSSSGHASFTDTTSWHSVIGVWASATSRQCFLDGTGDTANTDNRAPATITSFKIGVRGTDSQFADDVLIGYVAVWDMALDSTAIAAIAGGAHPQAVELANLIEWWIPDGDDVAGQLGAFNLTNTGSTYSTDNPTVDDPPAGGGGGGVNKLIGKFGGKLVGKAA